jgi:peptide/nickel transport system permease protein
MLTYLIKRLLLSVPIVLGVIFIVTLSLDLIPGDPVALMLGEFASPEAVAALRASLDLDKPLVVRYINYIGNILRGDLGRSLRDRRDVSVIIGETLPNTLKLAGVAIVIAIGVGVPLGVFRPPGPTRRSTTSCA